VKTLYRNELQKRVDVLLVEEQVALGECLQPFDPESLVLPVAVQKFRD
jgi:hypothetical protein